MNLFMLKDDTDSVSTATRDFKKIEGDTVKLVTL